MKKQTEIEEGLEGDMRLARRSLSTVRAMFRPALGRLDRCQFPIDGVEEGRRLDRFPLYRGIVWLKCLSTFAKGAFHAGFSSTRLDAMSRTLDRSLGI